MTSRNQHLRSLLATLLAATILVCAVLLTGCDLPFIGTPGQADTPSAPGNDDAPVSDGNPVPAGNPYRDCYDPVTTYVLAESADRYYVRAELRHLSRAQLVVALSEISARHGQSFADPDLQAYFDAMPWYRPSGEELLLTLAESANINLLELMLREADDLLYITGNPYLQELTDGELIPGSSERYIKAGDVEDLSPTQLVIARHEILARRGVVFMDENLQEYFYMQSWYAPAVHEVEFDKESLTDQENANTQLIQVYEKIAAGGYAPASDNPYMAYYDPATELLLSKGSHTKLTARDLRGYNEDQLIIIRNQIIALHGYTFGDQELMEYFLQCSWYRPSTAPGRSDLVEGMTSVEYENMDFIYQYEQNPQQGIDLDALDTALTYHYDQGFYSITIPAYWQEYAVISSSNSDGVPDISFYEKPDHQANGSGHLFTIVMMPANATVEFPQYQELGVLTDGRNYFRLLVRYPSDVQFSEENMDLYQKMDAEISRIIGTLTTDYSYVDYDPSLETD